ncbi:unnamed protein product [Scytosiphon promiscuus]
MRRRSRLEANRPRARSSGRRCLLYAVMAFLSLIVPAALTLLGSQPPPPAPPISFGDVESKGEGEDKAAAGLGAVSPLVWRGIGDGIPAVPVSRDDLHVVFSTDCSPYQNYQAIMLFHSAEMVGQRGPVTRVASGCTDEEMAELRELMEKQPERFRVHFTPDYSLDPETGESFMFYNKPNGMAHFLKNADPPVQEAVIALVDPDMIFMSPLTPHVGDSSKMLWHSPKHENGPEWVVEGAPVGQYYGLGGSWTTWRDLPEIIQILGEGSPAGQVSQIDAAANYPVGPPYLMHPRDWARVLDLWVALSPRVYKGHPGILAEMYGFCLAAAHLQLRHRVAYGLMVSDSRMFEKEGWTLVDVLGTEACDASSVDHRRGSLPPVVHYCQMYRVGTYMWGKRHQSHHNFFACDSDSLQLPPANYLRGPMGTTRVHPNRGVSDPERVEESVGVRQGYAMCAVLRAMNEALVSYKERYCRPEEVSGGVRRFTDLPQSQLEADIYA